MKVCFTDVSFRHACGIEVFHGLTCEVDMTRPCAVAGRNGSGKTTFLLLLAGLVKPASGTIERYGHAVSDMGFVFQNPDDSILGQTVEEDIALGLFNRGCGPRGHVQAIVDKTLADFGLLSLRGRDPLRMSFGQKKAAAVAAACASAPAFLCLDEPFLGLDDFQKQRIHSVLRALPVPFMFSTYDEKTAVEVVDDVYVIESSGSVRKTERVKGKVSQ